VSLLLLFSAAPKQTSVARLSLAPANTPTTRTSHTLNVRAKLSNAAHTGTIRAQLYEGATARSVEYETTNLTGAFADYALALTNTEAAAITSYSDLEVRFYGYAATGDAATFQVAEVWLQVPIGAPTRDVTDSVTFTDAVTRGPVSFVRTVTDSVTLADSATRGAAARSRTLTDSVTFADTATRGRPARRGRSLTRSRSARPSPGPVRALAP
jgi:hypothetical protein